jgi:hypothetical protein
MFPPAGLFGGGRVPEPEPEPELEPPPDILSVDGGWWYIY